MISDYWATDLSQYKPIDSTFLWGDCQALFGITQQGKIFLSDNKSRITIDSLRDVFKGIKYDIGIYAWKNKCPEIYVFDPLEKLVFNEPIQNGLRSLIGVHLIKKGTPVISNTSRQTLFLL